jgi:hypothetical protein
MPLPLLWRRCALLLLFVFVWDIGFELLASLHFDHEPASALVSANLPETAHPDCGLPDHECALSHHHHFPALVGTEHAITLAVATRQLAGTLPVSAYHRTSTARLIRGPPPLLPLQIFV